MKINDILPKVKANLSKERYEHTLRVIQTAKELAEIHDVNIEKVELASALHDYAKCEKESYLKKYIIDNKIDPDLLNYHPELWHAHVGAHYAEHSLSIEDKSILNAIKYHTTGRAGMDEVELVVFIADFTEPGRQIPNVEKVRETAKKNLQEAALLILKGTLPYLISFNSEIHPDTIVTYNDLIKLKGDR